MSHEVGWNVLCTSMCGNDKGPGTNLPFLPRWAAQVVHSLFFFFSQSDQLMAVALIS